MIISTAGAFLQIGGLSWDVTSHLLRQSETFFTPPHTILYTGVAIGALSSGIGVGVLGNRDLREKSFSTAFRLLIIGSGLQLIAGPADFWWHQTFGIDGLLSPTHLALITGICVNSVASSLGLARIIAHIRSSRKMLVRTAMIPAFATLWFSVTWLVYTFVLPLSQGQHFNFNMDPIVAWLISIIVLPLISSIVSLTASKTIGRFGATTAVVAVFMAMNIFSNIIPSSQLIPFLPWYCILLCPAIIADILLNTCVAKPKITHKKAELLAGAIIGSSFYLLNFPMLSLTLAAVLLYPVETVFQLFYGLIDNTLSHFLKTLPFALAITFVPGALIGISGAIIFSKKIDNIIR